MTIDTDRLREEGLEFDLAGYEYRVMTEFRGLSIEGLIKALGEVIEAMRALTANERLMKIVDLSQVDESSKTTSE